MDDKILKQFLAIDSMGLGTAVNVRQRSGQAFIFDRAAYLCWRKALFGVLVNRGEVLCGVFDDWVSCSL